MAVVARKAAIGILVAFPFLGCAEVLGFEDGAPRADLATGSATESGTTNGGGPTGVGGASTSTSTSTGGGDGGAMSACPGCAPNDCVSELAEDMSVRPSDWMLSGAATYDATAGAVNLANAGNGRVFYGYPIITDVFDLSFDYVLSLGDNDGLAFAIVKDPSEALGFSGGSLGLAGLAGFAAELDVFDNLTECGDPSDNHVGFSKIIQAPACPGSTYLEALGATHYPTLDYNDQVERTYKVHFNNGVVDVNVNDDVSTNVHVVIPGWLSGEPYWYGFASSRAATGAPGNLVRNITLTFPSPKCVGPVE